MDEQNNFKTVQTNTIFFVMNNYLFPKTILIETINRLYIQFITVLVTVLIEQYIANLIKKPLNVLIKLADQHHIDICDIDILCHAMLTLTALIYFLLVFVFMPLAALLAAKFSIVNLVTDSGDLTF